MQRYVARPRRALLALVTCALGICSLVLAGVVRGEEGDRAGQPEAVPSTIEGGAHTFKKGGKEIGEGFRHIGRGIKKVFTGERSKEEFKKAKKIGTGTKDLGRGTAGVTRGVGRNIKKGFKGEGHGSGEVAGSEEK